MASCMHPLPSAWGKFEKTCGCDMEFEGIETWYCFVSPICAFWGSTYRYYSLALQGLYGVWTCNGETPHTNWGKHKLPLHLQSRLLCCALIGPFNIPHGHIIGLSSMLYSSWTLFWGAHMRVWAIFIREGQQIMWSTSWCKWGQYLPYMEIIAFQLNELVTTKSCLS